MRTMFLLSAVFAQFGAGMALAETDLGSWESSFGSVSVQEDIANPKSPKHFVYLSPQEGSSSGGVFVLRCQENKTEVYYVADSGNFFGFSSPPDIKIRFGEDENGKKYRASGSSDGEAAFLSSPIDFIVNLTKSGSVVISGDYYSGKFAGLYKIDDTIADGIYGLADECGWVKKLPSRADAKVMKSDNLAQTDDASGGLVATDDSSGVTEELKAIIDKYGINSVKEAITKIEGK